MNTQQNWLIHVLVLTPTLPRRIFHKAFTVHNSHYHSEPHWERIYFYHEKMKKECTGPETCKYSSKMNCTVPCKKRTVLCKKRTVPCKNCTVPCRKCTVPCKNRTVPKAYHTVQEPYRTIQNVQDNLYANPAPKSVQYRADYQVTILVSQSPLWIPSDFGQLQSFVWITQYVFFLLAGLSIWLADRKQKYTLHCWSEISQTGVEC